MELYKALKEIIEQRGVEIMHSCQLPNILSDYKAFDELPASKYILRDIISESIVEKMCNERTQDHLELKITNISLDLVKKYGYIPSLVTYNLECIAYGLQLTTKIPAIGSTLKKDNQVVLTNGHISFKGISFSENIKDFVNKLICKGFTTDDGSDIEEGMNKAGCLDAFMEGSYAGSYGCKIIVRSTWLTHLVFNVSVSFPMKKPLDKDNWEYVKRRYIKLKEWLTNKYGLPLLSCEEYFRKPKLNGFDSDMEETECLFEMDDGSIRLSCFGVVYEDKANLELNEKEKQEDL